MKLRQAKKLLWPERHSLVGPTQIGMMRQAKMFGAKCSHRIGTIKRARIRLFGSVEPRYSKEWLDSQ